MFIPSVHNTIFRFLINIVYAFQNKENLYLVMDLVSGGDLRHHLVKQTKFNEQQASNK